MAMNPSLSLVPFIQLEDASRGFGASHRVYFTVSGTQNKKSSVKKEVVSGKNAVRTRTEHHSAAGHTRSRAAARRRARKAAAARARRKALLVTAVMMLIIISCFLMGLASKPEEQGPEAVKFFTTVTVNYGETVSDLVERYADAEHYEDADAYLAEIMQINHIYLKPGESFSVNPGDQLVVPYYSYVE